MVAILATVAFVATGTMTGVNEDAQAKLVRAEMMELAKAMDQFRQDTGYYPKQGPFDLDTATPPGAVPIDSLPSYAGTNNAERQRWFYSPANLEQLWVNPLYGTEHRLETWDANSGRGWRGPYLRGFEDGFVDIRDDINDGTAAGDPSGDPLAGDNIPDVPGLADPFEGRAVNVGGNTLLDWRADPGGSEREYWGRPFLVFGLVFGLDDSPSIVSMGRNGTYEPGGGGDDVILNLE